MILWPHNTNVIFVVTGKSNASIGGSKKWYQDSKRNPAGQTDRK